MGRLKRKLLRAICFLIGHRIHLRVGRWFGLPNEEIATWLACGRCGKLLYGPHTSGVR